LTGASGCPAADAAAASSTLDSAIASFSTALRS
jgi:hypothetical protein